MEHSKLSMNVSVVTGDDMREEIFVECQDPLLVRADVLVIDQDRNQLGAVVDGVMADLGALRDEQVACFAGHTQALLHARHFDGGSVQRHVPIINH